MKARATILLVCVLLFLAVMPWIISNLSPRPLLPNELRLERARYETRVATAQEATLDWQRKATSPPPEVFPIGTVEGEMPSNPAITSSSIQIVQTPIFGDEVGTLEETGEHMLTTTPISQTVSIVIVSTIVPLVTRTAPIGTPTNDSDPIIEVATETPDSTTAFSSPPPAATLTLPSGMVDKRDVITEEMITNQIKQDVDDSSLSDLTISITQDGIRAVTVVTVFPGVNQELVALGTFAIENYGLVVQLSSILLDEMDVTELYRAQLESQVNSSLYRLLPERFVQSYELGDGEIFVYSKVRP